MTPIARAHLAMAGALVAIFGFAAIQPARAADPLDGLTAAQAKTLNSVHLPVMLPARVPPSFRIYAVQGNAGYYADARLADFIQSTRRFTRFPASPPGADPNAAVWQGFSAPQRTALRTLPMAVVLTSYLPSAYRVVRVRIANARGPGGVNYSVTYSNGRGTIEFYGRNGGWGDADVPMRQLNVPVHSTLLGEAFLVAHKGDAPADCITHRSMALTISLMLGYQIKGCRVPPYELKRVIESARLVRPL